MFKNSMKPTIMFFILFLLFQFLFYQQIDWGKTIGISIIMFFLRLLFEWIKVPYNWNKKDANSNKG